MNSKCCSVCVLCALLSVACCADAVFDKVSVNYSRPAQRTAYDNRVAKKLTVVQADLDKALAAVTVSHAPGEKISVKLNVRAPSDKKPLGAKERRTAYEQGVFYIYGEDVVVSINAAYDFMKDRLGCRWFSLQGHYRGPQVRSLDIHELTYSFTPSIPILAVDFWTSQEVAADFQTRNNIMNYFVELLVNQGHAGQTVIPTGEIPFGGRRGNISGPLKELKDKAYMKSHPEFFSMAKNGERTAYMHLCYSNLQMRDEFYRNIEILLEKNNPKEKFLLGLGQDDVKGKFCYCPDCEALEKKYRHPAGAYFDFLLDMAARFQKDHPEYLLQCMAYRSEQTAAPSPIFSELPDNLLPAYSPLGCDFSKPLTHPVNAYWGDNFSAWGKVARRLRWQIYPTTYPRPVWSLPLVANLHRLVENIRFAVKNHVYIAMCETGLGADSTFSFQELRLYLISQLCRNVQADEAELIHEFTDAFYGPCAPLIRQYIAELEAAEAESDFCLRWNPDILAPPYMTGANLLRWEGYFDEMEKLAGADEALLLNIRRARFQLDEGMIAKWAYLSKDELAKAGDLETLIARAQKTIVDDRTASCAKITSEKRRKGAYDYFVPKMQGGLEQYVARARGGKPLPPELDKPGVARLLPNYNKLPLFADADAAFGLCTKGPAPKNAAQSLLFGSDILTEPLITHHYWGFPKELNMKRIEESKGDDGKYHIYHLGSRKITKESLIDISRFTCPMSTVNLALLYDRKNPDRRFDFYASIAYDKQTNEVRMDQIIAIPIDH